MLIKEDVIILRTILLEFGGYDQKYRMEFPYENMEVKGLEGAKGSTFQANIDCTDDLSCAFEGDEIKSIVYEFYLMGKYNYEKRDGELPDIGMLVIVEGKQQGVNRDNEDGIATRDRYIFLKGISKSDFFISLRMGLYYKCLNDYEKTVKHLKEANKIYYKTFEDTINIAVTNLTQYIEQYYDFDKSVYKEDYSFEKHGGIPEIKLPLELLVSLEESASFHLGEVYIDIADKFFSDYQSSKDISILDIAEENYAKAVLMLEEGKKWYEAIYYGQDIENPKYSIVKNYVINSPVSPYKRNYYWEVNYTKAKNQLRRIEEEKFLSAIKIIERPDPSLIEREVLRAISKEREKIKSVEQELTNTRAELIKFKANFPDPENIPLPLMNEIKLFAIFNESQDCLYWLDKDFNWKGLKYLRDGEVAGKIKNIRILTGTRSIDEGFKKEFQEVREELRDKETTIDIRVITKEYVFRKIHDRWIITDKNSHNIPPVGSIANRQLGTIYKEEDKELTLKLFNEWWSGGMDILTGDWKEIQNIREKMGRNRK